MRDRDRKTKEQKQRGRKTETERQREGEGGKEGGREGDTKTETESCGWTDLAAVNARGLTNHRPEKCTAKTAHWTTVSFPTLRCLELVKKLETSQRAIGRRMSS